MQKISAILISNRKVFDKTVRNFLDVQNGRFYTRGRIIRPDR